MKERKMYVCPTCFERIKKKQTVCASCSNRLDTKKVWYVASVDPISREVKLQNTEVKK